MPAQSTIEKAVRALDNMKVIVKNDMLEQGVYLTEEVVDPKLAERGAVCGGHKACAVGSLWLGYGIKMQGPKDERILPGVYVNTYGSEDLVDRDTFLKSRPGLKLAYDALNEAADKFIDKNDLENDLDHSFGAKIEALFEGTYDEKVHRKDMLQIINNAKRNILAAA